MEGEEAPADGGRAGPSVAQLEAVGRGGDEHRRQRADDADPSCLPCDAHAESEGRGSSSGGGRSSSSRYSDGWHTKQASCCFSNDQRQDAGILVRGRLRNWRSSSGSGDHWVLRALVVVPVEW